MEDTPHTHIEEFIKAFIIKERQERMLYLFNGSIKNKRKLEDQFLHELPIDSKYVAKSFENLKRDDAIRAFQEFLATKKVPEKCVVWSNKYPLTDDVRFGNAIESIKENMGLTDSVYSFIPGKLAFYTNDYGGQSCFLIKK